MRLEFAPVAGEAAFGDPALVGGWAAVLPDMVAPPQQSPWCSYAVREAGRIVGMGGFKGPPDGEGWAEIAYLTFAPERGRGLATAIAARLVDIATAGDHSAIRAHTLPAHSPSTRVLAANGFTMTGAVEESEDGTVWRWERT